MLFHIDQIKDDIVTNKLFDRNNHNPSVLSGAFGRLIFLAGIDDLNGEENFSKKINETIIEMIDFVNENRISNNSFDGLSGFFQGLSFLFDKGVIYSLDENDTFHEVDNYIISLSQEYFTNKNWDLLYGYIGLTNLLITRSKKNDNIKELLSEQAEKLIYFQKNTVFINSTRNYEINITHGLVSIVRFFTEFIESGNDNNEVEVILRDLCELILSTKENSRIPDVINGKERQFAPLRWCRGDLSTAYALGRAAKVLNNNDIFYQSEEIAIKLCQMRGFNEQELSGATICHGTFGVAHLFSKMEKIYRCPDIIKAKDYWYLESLKVLDSDIRYNYVDHNNKKAELVGLLNGKEGIGIAMLISQGLDSDYLDYFIQL